MSLQQELHRAHKARVARLYGRAVPDKPIDLRRKPAVEVITPPSITEPEPNREPPVVECVPKPKPAKVVYPRFKLRRIISAPGVIQVEPEPPIQDAPPRPQYPSIHLIKLIVSEWSGVSIVDMESERRTLSVVRPRQIAVYLSKKFTLKSLPAIGRAFGGRDHTTCLSACRRIDLLRGSDEKMDAAITSLEAKVSALTNPHLETKA